ncbi:hypothetical protein GQ53DRAFT_774785 [Thozetella sp. PMI_491]|nr:hypothetical protein GQ53DRAFT_774785 [Thozetella sp. PMI_491]
MPKDHHSKHKESAQPASKQNGKHPGNLPSPPGPGPWSRWFPQENGRWFYKARLLPNGHWDYAFTEGYPTGAQIGATYSAVRTTYPIPELVPGGLPTPGPHVQTAPRQRTVSAVQGADAQSPLPTRANGPEEDDNDDEEDSRAASSKHKKVKSKRKTKSSTGKPKDKSSKKLTGVVKAEKQLYVSSSKKVRGWLSEIGDLD